MFGNFRKNLVYLLILIIPFYFFFFSSESFSFFKFQIIKITNVPVQIISFPIKEFKKILFYHRTFEEYKKLNKEVNVLKARLVGLEEVIRENTRLETLLDFKRRLIYSSVVANVMGRNPSNWTSSMIIDKGEDDGIKLGMPVVNAYGVVGRIAEVDFHTSKVILLTDSQFSVAGLIQPPRETGLVTGSLKGTCRMKYINKDAKLRVGDQVITSKLSSSFPEGLLIGEVIRIDENQKSPSKICIIQPAVSFSQIEEVLVILKE